MALPMPRAAPVIKAVLPSKSPILFSNFKVGESHWLIIFFVFKSSQNKCSKHIYISWNTLDE
jgi:hypothetical protein